MRQEFHGPLLWALRRMVAGALVAAALPMAWADPPGRVGRIAETHGTVWVYAPDQQEWVQAEVNRPLTTGDRLAVDRDARAELTIGSTTVRLDGDSQVDVTELDDAHMRLQLEQGALAARLRDPEASTQFEVTTQQGRFAPLQPGHYRIDIADDETLALAWSGNLRFDASDSTLTIGAGHRAELWQENGVTHYSWADLPDDDFGNWVLAADHRDELAAARQRYVPIDMTGWEDLDRAGRWETTVEYGTVWIPVQVAPGWAPYQQGHWVWMAPWGWTWVDDAPWGFAPFHYGRWVWWGQRWCWVPGRYVRHPVYAPALVGWVGASPVYSGSGPAPLVGWVPLAPGEPYYPGYSVGPGHWHALNPHDPRRSYRPAPPPRANANFLNAHAPGAVTLMPASTFAQARPALGVVAHQPGVSLHGTTPAPGHPGSAPPSHGLPFGGSLVSKLAPASPPPAPSRTASPGSASAVPLAPNARRRPPFERPPGREPVDAARGTSASPVLPASPRPPAVIPAPPTSAVRLPAGHGDHAVPVTRPAPGGQGREPADGLPYRQNERRTTMPIPHPHASSAVPAATPLVRPPSASLPSRPAMPPQMPMAPRTPRGPGWPNAREPMEQAAPPRPAVAQPPVVGAVPAPVMRSVAPPPSVVTRVAPHVVAPAHPGAVEKADAASRDERAHAPGDAGRHVQP